MTCQNSEEQELAYALVTPYSLHKSRTGGIIARLMWADVRMVAARMYAPSGESRPCDLERVVNERWGTE